MDRYLKKQVLNDLQKKMVFLGGPRQVGKTTLVKSLLKKGQYGYLNYDIDEDRENILRREWPNSDFWIFDELHKFRRWCGLLKGLFDKYKDKKKILVTGSARLDFYRFGGDSLQGRYHYLRLHPFSTAELKITNNKDFLDLLKLGGFPEPFLSGSEIEAKRWSREYRNRLIKEEIISLERIEDIGRLEQLILRLPALVGSPLSINSLREDLQTSHRTTARWLDILDRMYAIFRVLPFGAPQIRAVKKETKHYHFDWSLIVDEAKRFENFVACHLLKWVNFQEDALGEDIELRYFRDVDLREVDFVVVKNGKPFWLIECKWDDTELGKGLKYLKERFPAAKAWQISAIGKKNYVTEQEIHVCPALDFLKELV